MEDLSLHMDYSEFVDIAVDVTPALQAFGKTADVLGLERPLTELIKLHASQINGYAFYIQFHLNLARKLHVAPAKLDLVATWRDTSVVSTPRERTMLVWTEVLTTLARAADHGVEDHEYNVVLEHFSRTEVVFLAAAAINIQTWNHITVAMRFMP